MTHEEKWTLLDKKIKKTYEDFERLREEVTEFYEELDKSTDNRVFYDGLAGDKQSNIVFHLRVNKSRVTPAMLNNLSKDVKKYGLLKNS